MFLCVFVLKITSGAMVKISPQQKYFEPPMVSDTDRSKAVLLVVFLFCEALWFLLRSFSC